MVKRERHNGGGVDGNRLHPEERRSAQVEWCGGFGINQRTHLSFSCCRIGHGDVFNQRPSMWCDDLNRAFVS